MASPVQGATTPLYGAAARRQQREEDSRKRKAAAPEAPVRSQAAQPAVEETSREKRAALQQMMQAEASPGGVVSRHSANIVSDAVIPEAVPMTEVATSSILRSPEEQAREIAVRISLAEEEAIRNVIEGTDLLVFITHHHANSQDEKIIEMWKQADGQEKAMPHEAASYFQYLLAMAIGKFQANRQDHPTTNTAYQNASDAVIIAGCKIELLKVINKLYNHVNRLSPRYMQEKVLAARQATARFDVIVQNTLSKIPHDLLSKVRETLEHGNDEEKARLRGQYVVARPDFDAALDKLYTFFSEPQNAFLRPLFIDKYCHAIHLKTIGN